MPAPSRLRLRPVEGHALRAAFAQIRDELGVSAAFRPEVRAAAVDAAARPRPPAVDRTDLELVTIDPPGSMDLDQAVHVSRHGDGHRLNYAIADVAAFVTAGDQVDRESFRRGQTLYAPDGRIPLHPPELSEGAASLLEGQDRPAVLWTVDVSSDGTIVDIDVVRALVRSRARLDYETVQQHLDAGTADDALVALRELGRVLQEAERRRGGIDLPAPEQEVVADAGRYHLEFRSRRPVEGWNAQMSLLTGRAAAALMLDARVGILRTLPEAPPEGVEQLRRAATVLDIDWGPAESYADVVRRCDATEPAHLAFLQQATVLLRGSGYTPFAGAAPETSWHAGVAAQYAHVTAPLRRLVDRFGTECALAACRGEEPPEWAVAALPELPAVMTASDRLAGALERATIDVVEAAVLAPYVGETFEAVVVEASTDAGTVALRTPAVRARCAGKALPVGQRVVVRLAEASFDDRKVRFELA
ncbi:MAG: RNB domain-containing ribonuclease [Actinomycetota bacterium]|nr:RNB domain-containing ribonuclease [Actinomycetota bacterium]